MSQSPRDRQPATSDLVGLRIGLLTASASRLGGGVFQAVAAQAALIEARGGEARVFSLVDAFSAADAGQIEGSVEHAPVVGPGAIGFAPSLVDRLVEAELDCLHLHGIWMYPSRAATQWASRTGRPYVISPHGMLDPWITARRRGRKAIARIAYERASWRAAAAFHALTEREAADIARESGRDDTFVVANPCPAIDAPRHRAPPPGLLYIGRIHPKKNLAALVRAWSRCAALAEAHGARLTIAGWGEDAHVAELRALLAKAPDSAEFVGPAYGEDKARLLRSARFLVLPSYSEGLPMAILEAWAAGVPTIMTDACNLDQGFAVGAAFDCGHDEHTVAARIGAALAMPEPAWLAMSSAARTLAEAKFGPEVIAARWCEHYRALLQAQSIGESA